MTTTGVIPERRAAAMVRWSIFCALCIYLFSSQPLLAMIQSPLLVIAPVVDPSPVTASLAAVAAEQVDQLVAPADLLIEGKVLAVHSGWNPEQTLIESTATVAITKQWLGSAGRIIEIHSIGGYLPEAGLGLVSNHEATFRVGEELLLFLYQVKGEQGGTQWRVVRGAQGQWVRQGDRLSNADLGVTVAHREFVAQVEGAHTRATAIAPTLQQGVARLQGKAPTAFAVRPFLTGAGQRQKWATPHARADFYLNLNSTQIDSGAGDRAAFHAAIASAAQQWSEVAAADFTLHHAGETTATATGFNGANEVLFMHKGAAERVAAAQVWYKADGTIIEADIWINDDYALAATDEPTTGRVDLQSALLHEFGHWLILGHTDQTASVMFPRLAPGTTKRTLQVEDRAGISAIYPR